MNLSILTFFHSLGGTYPSVGYLAEFISGPFSYVVFPALILGFFSTRAKGSMNTFSLIFLSLFSAWASARALKEIFRVLRPFHTHSTIVPLVNQSGYSFPSEHASIYGALTVILFHFDYRLGFGGLTVGLLVMISRLVLGVHYPLDVIAGAFLGGCIAYLFIRLLRGLSQ